MHCWLQDVGFTLLPFTVSQNHLLSSGKDKKKNMSSKDVNKTVCIGILTKNIQIVH